MYTVKKSRSTDFYNQFKKKKKIQNQMKNNFQMKYIFFFLWENGLKNGNGDSILDFGDQTGI